MTLVFEISRPFQLTPGKFKSRLMYRYWWLWFAVGFLRVPFKEFCETEQAWIQ